MTAPADLTIHRCLKCDAEDHHPKVHVMYGKNLSTGVADWAHLHHDCTEDTPWHEQLVGDPSGEGERFRAIAGHAFDGRRGHDLRAWIEGSVGLLGTGPTMATTGFDVAQGEGLLNAWHPNSSTKTIGALTITAPINIRAIATVGADDNHLGTEITTGNSYTSGGAGLGSPTWGTATVISNIASLTTITSALTKTNMPARAINGLEEWDSSGTPQRGMWGTVTLLTTNSGDSVSIAIGALVDTFA